MKLTKVLALSAVFVGLSAAPAMAGSWGFSIGLGHGGHRGVRLHIGDRHVPSHHYDHHGQYRHGGRHNSHDYGHYGSRVRIRIGRHGYYSSGHGRSYGHHRPRAHHRGHSRRGHRGRH